MSEGVTCTKTKALHEDLVTKTPDTSSEDEEALEASIDGSRNLIKKRTSVHSVVRRGEATATAKKFVPEVQELMTSGIMAEEKSLPATNY